MQEKELVSFKKKLAGFDFERDSLDGDGGQQRDHTKGVLKILNTFLHLIFTFNYYDIYSPFHILYLYILYSTLISSLKL